MVGGVERPLTDPAPALDPLQAGGDAEGRWAVAARDPGDQFEVDVEAGQTVEQNADFGA